MVYSFKRLVQNICLIDLLSRHAIEDAETLPHSALKERNSGIIREDRGKFSDFTDFLGLWEGSFFRDIESWGFPFASHAFIHDEYHLLAIGCPRDMLLGTIFPFFELDLFSSLDIDHTSISSLIP